VHVFHAGRVLVKFYGDLQSMWVRPTSLRQYEPDEETALVNELIAWGKKNRRCAGDERPCY
jgi:hypothetical protein